MSQDLHPDPVDYQIIRFSNCIQVSISPLSPFASFDLRISSPHKVCSCLCDCVACLASMRRDCREFAPTLRQMSSLIDLLAECVVRCVLGCMGAQIRFYTRSNPRFLLSFAPTARRTPLKRFVFLSWPLCLVVSVLQFGDVASDECNFGDLPHCRAGANANTAPSQQLGAGSTEAN